MEVSNSKLLLRVVLAVIACAIAVSAFGYAISSLLNRNGGWQKVDAYVDGVDCSSDFVLQYYFDSVEVSATTEYKAVSALYTSALEEAYQAFYPEGSIKAVNANPNVPVKVDPVLYRALEIIQTSGNRCIYLGPVYVEYDRIFLCEDELEAAHYDPGQDDESGAYVAQVAAYANNPEHINLQLLDDGQVCMKVSDEYLAFADDNGIEKFLDFGWMTNAFIIDHIADTLSENGYMTGYISSYDGFTRNLDNRGLSYSLNLFDRLGNDIYQPAVMDYSKPMSLVNLRNYPMSNADRWHYFAFSNGRIVTSFIDPVDGMSKSSTDNLLAYSEILGCAQILLEVSPLYLSDELDEAALVALAEQGIDTVWFEDAVLKCTQKSLALTATEGANAAGYQIP